jgi:hypothetical protein
MEKKNGISVDAIGCFLRQLSKEYRNKLLRKWFRKSIIKPWGRYREIEIIEEVLQTLKPQRCLEWGTGFGTLYFTKLIGEKTRWISVEHEKDWSINIEKLNQNRNVQIGHVPPNLFPWSDPHRDGAYSDLKDYIEFPTQFGKFDFILVDGRARVDCVVKASELIEEDGIVILHDANRKHYHSVFHLFRHQVLFTDHRTCSGGIWVASKGREIRSVLKIDQHEMLYRLYHRYAKLLHV